MSSELNLDLGACLVGIEAVSWGLIAGIGAGGNCTAAGFGKEYGLMIDGVVCITENRGIDDLGVRRNKIYTHEVTL